MSKTFKGVDVSRFQNNIDFNKVKKAGYSFVIPQCGYGNMVAYPYQKDPKFETNYKNAKAAGLGVGCYFYSYATTVEGAKAEAQGVLNVIKGKQFDYPIGFDIEEKSQMELSANQKAAVIEAFISVLENAGYYVVLYSFESFLNTVPITTLAKYDIWCANIDNKPNMRYGIWQNSWVGKVDGINGDVDTDIAEKDYPTIIKGAGLNGYPKTDTNSKKVKEDTTPFDKFFTERLNKGIDYDGQYNVQCFDLANDYAVNLIGGKPFIGMGAYEIYTNFANQPSKDLYERIPNTPEFVPIKGDIMVWGTGLGKNGHVAICNGKGDTTWFESYEQNWTGHNDSVALIKHNYNNVLGVLRPKDQSKILGKTEIKVETKTETKPAPKTEIKKPEEKANTETAKVRKNGDVNGDGVINISDVVALAAHVKGKKLLKD